jgi:sugar phosphate permease
MCNRIDGLEYAWIPTILIIIAAFFSHMGLKMLPWILAGEVFPSEVRSVATGAASSIGYIFSSIANKVFYYMKNGMTLPGTFLFYAIVNFAGLISLYFLLPETEGKTLKEIEHHFAGIQKLGNKSKRQNLNIQQKWAVGIPQIINSKFESRL